MTRRAILSVHDKSGLIDLGRSLVEMGWELVASGGTARALRDAALPVLDVAAVTGAPEILGGRVKTLHPAVHGGILARASAADMAELVAQGIAPIDLVICNLYPFRETVSRPGVSLAESVEQIDIGGVTLLRAAAKNFDRVTVICDPADYRPALDELGQTGAVTDATRRALAAKAFALCRDYDAAIADYLLAGAGEAGVPFPERLTLSLTRRQSLRYGENPHQAAALYATHADGGPLGGELLQGKELSYNNLLDLDAAWRAAESFAEPAIVIVKHLSPCGIASAATLAEAFEAALASDPLSAFGGVIAANRPVGSDLTEALAAADLFVEAIVAPEFSAEARAWLAAKKKNCRLVALGPAGGAAGPELRSVRGGYLLQQPDLGDPADAEWQVVSQRQPTDDEWSALRFAWLAAGHVKSNAIVLAQETATVGIGGGLPSRVDAVRLAIQKAGERADGAVMASDAFFPFPDGVEVAAAAGARAVIEPGGSVRDDEIIAAADRLGLALVFTGVRHFRH
jgi:phosphoribosylaminoimidazolecarboxamide formyltransferase/IMP cyclohydrolase